MHWHCSGILFLHAFWQVRLFFRRHRARKICKAACRLKQGAKKKGRYGTTEGKKVLWERRESISQVVFLTMAQLFIAHIYAHIDAFILSWAQIPPSALKCKFTVNKCHINKRKFTEQIQCSGKFNLSSNGKKKYIFTQYENYRFVMTNF